MSDYAIEDASASISSAVYDWLEAEITTSGTDRNCYLDEYESAVDGLKGGWDHPKNFTARKLEAHLDRLPVWYEAFSLAPDDDFQAARLSFAGLMQLSGSYRNQCYVEAENAEDYLTRRQKVAGISIQKTIRGRLHELLGPAAEFERAKISIDDIESEIAEVSKDVRTKTSGASYRIKQGADLGIEGSFSAHKFQEAQFIWLRFTTDCITLAAKLRKGELEAVPFLEPRSISDQSGSTYYPLREAVNWAELMAT